MQVVEKSEIIAEMVSYEFSEIKRSLPVVRLKYYIEFIVIV